MDNLENDILELFEDDAGTSRGSERNHGDNRSRSRHKRRRHGKYGSPQRPSRRDDYSGSEREDVDMEIDEDVDIEDTGDSRRQHSGASDDDDEFMDEWGDDLMGDQKDRRWLASLTEVERERILAERQEKRDLMNEQRELRMKLKAGARVSGGSDHAGRSQRSSRDASRRSGGGISDLKRARERRRRGADDRWSSSLSDEEAESDDNAEPAASLEEINSICLTRNQLEQWLFRPFLADTIVGCFVRIVTRNKDSSGEYNQYKMMEVMEVVQGEGRSQPPYHLNKTLTDKYLVLRFGGAMKNYSMETISNSPIKPEEHGNWNSALRADRVRGNITTGLVQKKLQALERARNYQLSESEVAQMIEERNRLRKLESGGGSSIGVTVERTQLLQLHLEARQSGDWKEVKSIEARLEELERLDKQAKDSSQASASLASNKPLLAPSSSRGGGGSVGSGENKVMARRRKFMNLTPSSQRPSPAARSKLGSSAPAEGKFPVVPELKVPELSLRSKVTPGYVEMMADNGGYDMSFLKL